MSMGRRDLLSLGAALAVSAVASSCSAGDPAASTSASPSSARSPLPATPTTPPPARMTSRPGAFPGSPPPGSLFYGASVPHHRSLPEWERQLGNRLSVNRSYFTPERNESGQLNRRCHDDLARDRLPHVSIKPPATWRELASGAWDEWLGDLFRPLADATGPVLFTLHHEPENDAGPPGMQPFDFVAMQRRTIEIAADLAPNVVIAPTLQQWTFDPVRTGTDPGVWIVPEAPVMGLDLYNPWSTSTRKPWRSFASKCDEVLPWIGDTPLAIGEYGCRDNPDNPGLAAEWLRDAAQYAREHNIVSMCYFNSHLNSPEGSWELYGATEEAFAELLAADWVARPA